MTGPRFLAPISYSSPSAAIRPRRQCTTVPSRSSMPATTRSRYRCCRSFTFRRPGQPGPMRCRTISQRGLFARGCASRCRKFPYRSCPAHWRLGRRIHEPWPRGRGRYDYQSIAVNFERQGQTLSFCLVRPIAQALPAADLAVLFPDSGKHVTPSGPKPVSPAGQSR